MRYNNSNLIIVLFIEKRYFASRETEKVQVFNRNVYLLTHWIRTGNVELFAGQKVFDVSVKLQLKYLSNISKWGDACKTGKIVDGSQTAASKSINNLITTVFDFITLIWLFFSIWPFRVFLSRSVSSRWFEMITMWKSFQWRHRSQGILLNLLFMIKMRMYILFIF